MTRVSVTELKAKLSGYLARVKRGGEVCVSERGRTVAWLVPADRGIAGLDAETAELVRNSVLIPPTRKLPGNFLVRSPYKDPAGSVVNAIIEERDRARGR